jgi:pimeloyl-ACP methyl ester carboxylesterase
VLAPGDSLVAADSLAAAFAAAGRSVVLLPPRGTGAALGPGAYGPEDWAGRPAARFAATIAADAAAVMYALDERGQAPHAGWVVAATGDAAPVALAIAGTRHDTRALLLVAPKLPVVEVAEYRARLRALGTRTFVQVSPEEPDALELGDLLARQTAPGQVRVADSGARGRGETIFRADPKVAKRLLDWLAEPAAKK